MKIAKHTQKNTCAVLTFLMLLCAFCLFSSNNKVQAVTEPDEETQCLHGTVTLDESVNSSEIGLEGVSLTLYLDGKETEYTTSITYSTEEGKYVFDFEDVPAGEATFKFTSLEGWDIKPVTGTEALNLVVTKKTLEPEPETVPIEINVIWKDDNNSLGLRPESVGYLLLKNGEDYDGADISSTDGWKATHTVTKFAEDGSEAKYTLTVDSVDNYECTVDGFTATYTLIKQAENVDGDNSGDEAPKNTLQTGENSSHMNLALLLIVISSVSLSYIFIKNKGNSVEL